MMKGLSEQDGSGAELTLRCLETQEAKVGFLMPHCQAKAGPLSELSAKAARTSCLY